MEPFCFAIFCFTQTTIILTIVAAGLLLAGFFFIRNNLDESHEGAITLPYDPEPMNEEYSQEVEEPSPDEESEEENESATDEDDLYDGQVVFSVEWNTVYQDVFLIKNNSAERVIVTFTDQSSADSYFPDSIALDPGEDAEIRLDSMPNFFTVEVDLDQEYSVDFNRPE